MVNHASGVQCVQTVMDTLDSEIGRDDQVMTGNLRKPFPEGACAVCTLLDAAAYALVEGGTSGIFTPMFFFLARKPERPGG